MSLCQPDHSKTLYLQQLSRHLENIWRTWSGVSSSWKKMKQNVEPRDVFSCCCCCSWICWCMIWFNQYVNFFFFMKPRCFSSIRKCGKRLIFKKILPIWIWFHKKKLSLLFLLINSLTGLIYFGKVCICRRQPLHCRLLMVNACLVVWRPIIKKILKRIFFTTGWSEIFSTLGFRDAFLSMWWCLTRRREAKISQSHYCC